MREPLIEFQGVTKTFGEKLILDRVDLTIYPGDVTTLLGKSGVGKSVTLKLIMGLMVADRGKILYKGKNVPTMSRKELSAMKHEVEFMFQGNALFDSLNIFENIALPLQETTRLGQSAIAKKVQEKIDFLELSGHEDKYPAEVSGGMRKRVALARALVTEPQVVLFDEPTTGLDPVRKINVLSLIVDNQKKFGFSGILVSHDVPDVLYVSNRIVLIDEAKVVFQGSPMDLEHHPHLVIREFMDSLQDLENRVIDLKTAGELESDFQTWIAQETEPPGLVFVVSLENLAAVQESLGQVTAHQLLASLAGELKKQLEARGGLLGRKNHNTLIGVLPASNHGLDPILNPIQETFGRLDFLEQSSSGPDCVPVRISSGSAEVSEASGFRELLDRALPKKVTFFELGCLVWRKHEG